MKTLLLILLSFTALSSSLGGLLMVGNPGGEMTMLPGEVLAGTPFKNFLIPGLILTGSVALVNCIALFHFMRRKNNRYNWVMAAGFILCGWIVVQMILTGLTHWLHFVYLVTGLLMVLIAYQLKGKWAV